MLNFLCEPWLWNAPVVNPFKHKGHLCYWILVWSLKSVKSVVDLLYKELSLYLKVKTVLKNVLTWRMSRRSMNDRRSERDLLGALLSCLVTSGYLKSKIVFEKCHANVNLILKEGLQKVLGCHRRTFGFHKEPLTFLFHKRFFVMKKYVLLIIRR